MEDLIGAILVLGSVVFSGLYGYTVIDAIRTIRMIGKAEHLREGRELKIGHARVGFGMALDTLFWPGMIVLLTIPDPATEDVRRVIFISAWFVSGVVRLVAWVKIQ